MYAKIAPADFSEFSIYQSCTKNMIKMRQEAPEGPPGAFACGLLAQIWKSKKEWPGTRKHRFLRLRGLGELVDESGKRHGHQDCTNAHRWTHSNRHLVTKAHAHTSGNTAGLSRNQPAIRGPCPGKQQHKQSDDDGADGNDDDDGKSAYDDDNDDDADDDEDDADHEDGHGDDDDDGVDEDDDDDDDGDDYASGDDDDDKHNDGHANDEDGDSHCGDADDESDGKDDDDHGDDNDYK
jgi:hypothetical protein